MAILNVTPDSFAGDGCASTAEAVSRGRQMLAEGADILDVGGESTRPGAARVPEDEELRRVIPVVGALAAETGAILSVDTTKAAVARKALAAGAAIINEVSALLADPRMAGVAAASRARVVLMHGYATRSPLEQPSSTGIIEQIRTFLAARMEAAVAAGIPRDRIVVDPGFGFGKSVDQNLEVLRRLGELRALGRPILIGTSRKGTIGKVLGGLPVEDRLEGTAATVAAAILNGADIVRVHDVRAMVRVARMTDAIKQQA